MLDKSLELSALDAEFNSLITNSALAAELAGIAGVSDLVDFKESLGHAFRQWLYYKVDVPAAEAAARQISQIRRTGSRLQKQLEGLVDLEKQGHPLRLAARNALELEKSQGYPLRLNFPLDPSEFVATLISNVSRVLLLLKSYQQLAIRRRELRGSPKGAKRNPASHLVLMLQFAALFAGGKFKLDKNTREGTLVDALELIRRHLMVKERLPAPGRHPVSAYQKALSTARYVWKQEEAGWPAHPALDD